MNARSLTTIRLLLLPLLAMAAYVAYGYALQFFGEMLSIIKDRSLILAALLTQGFLAAAVVSLLFSYPLALLYRQVAVYAALLMAVPVLVQRMPELTIVDRHPIALAISAYEVFAYTLLLVAGTWLAYRHLARSNPAFESGPDRKRPTPKLKRYTYFPEDFFMRVLQTTAGGLITGLLMVAGEAILNLLLLADEWAKLFSQLALPQPTVASAAQGVLKLILLGFFSVWLAVTFKPVHVSPRHAGIVTGIIVWFLVWAWVQWGMLLAGYVSPTIAATTVIWGFIELPLAVWAGVSLHSHLTWRSTGARL